MIEFDKGIHLKGTSLWFDSIKKANFSFISSANIGRFAPSEKVIATPETLRLIEKRIRKSVALACPYNRPFTIGSAQAELMPSGYMLGAAQIEIKTAGRSILYAGDISLRQSLTAEPIRIKGCPIVILKCTYGSPEYEFLPVEDVMRSLSEFIDRSLASGAVPVLLAEAPGAAEELVKALGDAGYGIGVHRSIYGAVKIYEEFGVMFENCDLFRPKKVEGRVLVFPLQKGLKDIEDIRSKRVGAVIESAPDEISYIKNLYGADEVFPLSRRAGYGDLLKFVESVGPEKVFLTGAHSSGFARALQKKGFEAVPLEKPVQLRLF
jgi:Cft2 family RNA processing exonuclease